MLLGVGGAPLVVASTKFDTMRSNAMTLPSLTVNRDAAIDAPPPFCANNLSLLYFVKDCFLRFGAFFRANTRPTWGHMRRPLAKSPGGSAGNATRSPIANGGGA